MVPEPRMASSDLILLAKGALTLSALHRPGLPWGPTDPSSFGTAHTRLAFSSRNAYRETQGKGKHKV